jgi:hypothetical protein
MKGAIVIAIIVLATGLGVAVKGNPSRTSVVAGPTHEFEPHTHLIREPSRLEICVGAVRSNRTC